MGDLQNAPTLIAPSLTAEIDVRAQSRLRAGRLRRAWLPGLIVWAAAAAALNLSPLGRELNPYLSITGLLVGFLVGLTGMGGGALLTPILIFVFGFAPSLAIGTDIAYAAVTKAFGSWRHIRYGSVDKPVALWLALGSVPAGVLAATSMQVIKTQYGAVLDTVLYGAVGGALMLAGVLLVVRLLYTSESVRPLEDITMSTTRKVATVCLGASTGFLIGLTSVGSGTLVGLVLILFYPLATRRIVGTDIFHATILLGATALAQLRFGNVEPWMVASLLIGSVPGVIVGSKLTARAPARPLRFALATVLVLSGVALLGKA